MLETLIGRYGLLALGLGAAAEGETVVVLGGLMVHRGLLSYLPAVMAAALGSFVADQLYFLLGRRFRGHRLVRKAQARPAFQRALAAFDRRPGLFVFGFRFLYGLRTISPIAIGTTSLPAPRFLALNAAAALVWGLVFVSVGYLFGQTIEAFFGRVRAIEHILLPVIGLSVVVAAISFAVRHQRGGNS